MNTFVFYYVTIDKIANAKKLAKELVIRGVAGCVNIIENMAAVYKWEGKLEEGKECVMIIKTLKKNSKKLEQNIKELHPYSVPCIAQIPIGSLNKSYANWLKSNCEE